MLVNRNYEFFLNFLDAKITLSNIYKIPIIIESGLTFTTQNA